MTAQGITHKYRPRHAFRRFHERAHRFALLVCHRRAGKTVAVVNDLVTRAMRTRKPNANYGYIAPTFGQAKNIAWVYIKTATKDIPGIKTSESECSVVLPNGSKIRCYGVDNPDALRGVYFDGVVCDEFGEWEGRAYTEVIRPAIADRQGWVVFIGTPKGPSNKFAKLRETAMASGGRWFYMELKASESGLLPQSELDELRADMDPEEYEQELECSFTAANKGTYFGRQLNELERRGAIVLDQVVLRDFYVPTEKVVCAMDIGFDDATAIWFWQVIDGEQRFIDYWEESGYDAEEVCELLENRPYEYETVWLPHDAKARTFRSKQSVLDVFREHHLPARKVPNPDEGNRVLHGISAVRRKLRVFPMRFDGVRCARGLEALRNYSRRWYADEGVFAEKAKHDQWSHGADGFRYACLSTNEADLQRSRDRAARFRAARATQNGTTSVNSTSGWTFNDVLVTHETRLRRQQGHGEPRV